MVGEEIFVVYRTGGIKFFDPTAGVLKVFSKAAFVSQRPDQGRGIVFIPQHAALHAVQNGITEPGVIRQVGIGLHTVGAVGLGYAVAFHVRFSDYIETVL